MTYFLINMPNDNGFTSTPIVHLAHVRSPLSHLFSLFPDREILFYILWEMKIKIGPLGFPALGPRNANNI